MYIAFLRSINLGKINKIAMSELIKLFYELGYDNIKTHLNTDNVMFNSEASNTSEMEDYLYEILSKEVNLYIPGGYGKTKLNNKFVENKSTAFATTRNINTLEKILNLMS